MGPELKKNEQNFGKIRNMTKVLEQLSNLYLDIQRSEGPVLIYDMPSIEEGELTDMKTRWTWYAQRNSEGIKLIQIYSRIDLNSKIPSIDLTGKNNTSENKASLIDFVTNWFNKSPEEKLEQKTRAAFNTDLIEYEERTLFIPQKGEPTYEVVDKINNSTQKFEIADNFFDEKVRDDMRASIFNLLSYADFEMRKSYKFTESHPLRKRWAEIKDVYFNNY